MHRCKIGPLYCTVIGSLTCKDISGWKTNWKNSGFTTSRTHPSQFQVATLHKIIRNMLGENAILILIFWCK